MKAKWSPRSTGRRWCDEEVEAMVLTCPFRVRQGNWYTTWLYTLSPWAASKSMFPRLFF